MTVSQQEKDDFMHFADEAAGNFFDAWHALKSPHKDARKKFRAAVVKLADNFIWLMENT